MTININELWQQQTINNADLEKYLHRKESESNDLLMQLANKYQANIKWIGIGALLSMIVFPLLELYYMGAALTLTFVSVYIISNKRLNALHLIDKNQSCLAYLTDYRQYLRQSQQFYGKLYQFVYPLLFVSALGQFFTGEVGEYFLLSFTDDNDAMVFGVPVLVACYSLLATGLIAISAKALYNKEVEHIYGQDFSKLDGLISELEALT